MSGRATLIGLALAVVLPACGGLETKSSLVNVGDGKEAVLAAMGDPDDRQLKGDQEAWQYCQTGAGFGYHDYRVVWFSAGRVSGITSYKATGVEAAGKSCMAAMRQVDWVSAPDVTVEVRILHDREGVQDVGIGDGHDARISALTRK